MDKIIIEENSTTVCKLKDSYRKEYRVVIYWKCYQDNQYTEERILQESDNLDICIKKYKEVKNAIKYNENTKKYTIWRYYLGCGSDDCHIDLDVCYIKLIHMAIFTCDD